MLSENLSGKDPIRPDNVKLAKYVRLSWGWLLLAGFLAAVGIVLLKNGIQEYAQMQSFLAHAERTVGTITGIEERTVDTGGISSRTSTQTWRPRSTHGTGYFPVIQFTDLIGETHSFLDHRSTRSSPSSHPVGDKVEVIYLPEQPEDARLATFEELWLTVAFLLVFGTIISLGAVGIITFVLRKYRQAKRLLCMGRRIATTYVSTKRIAITRRRRNTRVKHIRHTFVITSQWQDPKTQRQYMFKSLPLPFNPERFIQDKPIDVLIDPENPRDHLMDISFLPERT